MSGYSDFSFVYDLLTGNVDYPARAKYIASILRDLSVEGGLLLDLACGTGKLSVELSRLGYEVIGVDASEDMLCVAADNVAQSGENVMLLNQAMQELDLFGTVRGAVCSLDSINHLTEPEDVRETFRRLALFIEPGGCFVFDVNTPFKHAYVLADNTFVYDLDEVFCCWQNQFIPETCSVRVTLDFFTKEDDEVYLRSGEEFTERAYTVSELTSWLDEAGFEVRYIFDEMTRQPMREDSQRLYFAAVRR